MTSASKQNKRDNKRYFILSLFIGITVILSSINTQAQINIEQYMFEGRNKIYFSNYTGAIDNFNMIIRLKPHLSQPYYYRAIAKHNLEDLYGSKRDLDRAIEIKPYFPDAFMYRGMINHTLKNYEIALDDYNRAIALDIRDYSVYNNRGIAYATLEIFDKAIEDYTKALEINPTASNTLLNRAMIYQLQERYKESIDDCNRAIELKPYSAPSYIMRGRAELEMKDYASAIKDIDRAIELDDKSENAYFLRALIKHRLEDYRGAINDYTLAINNNQSLAGAYYNRAIAKSLLGEYAQDDYNRAAEMDSEIAALQKRLKEEQERERDPWYYALSQKYKNSQNRNSTNTTGKSNSSNSGQSSNQNSNQNSQNIAPNNQSSNTTVAAAVEDEYRSDIIDSTEIATQDSLKFIVALNKINNLSLSQKLKLGQTRREEIRKGAKNDFVIEDNGEISFDKESSDSSREDGLIQNDNIIIDLAQNFAMIAISKYSGGYNQIQYYSMEVEDINVANNDTPLMTINNLNTDENINAKRGHMKYISEYTDQIKSKNSIEKNLLNRATLYLQIKDYNRSLIDFNRYIKQYNLNTVALLGRGNCNTALADYVMSIDSNNTPEIKDEDIDLQQPLDIKEYNSAIKDFSAIVDMNPRFIFARFNRANVYIKIKKYDKALEDYSRCIDISPDFAEAYYNRGLTNIYLGRIEDGATDLSKAGELGLKSAYNILKRYAIY